MAKGGRRTSPVVMTRIRKRQLELVERAKAAVEPNLDGGWNEDRLLDKIIELNPFDVEAARRREALDILAAATRPGNEPDGQLALPGFDAFDYEPKRLVRDGVGNLYEHDKAPLVAVMAEASRAREHANSAMYWSNIKATESELMAAWVVEQLTSGRPATELTWGNFIRETGLWRPSEAITA